MKYKSTRSKTPALSSSEAIIRGIAADGGLYVPMEIPMIDRSLEDLSYMSYKDLAYYIMSKYLTDFDEEELRACIAAAYNEKFDTPLIAPLVEKAGVHFLELYHGPTLAFKDMALSILPQLLKTSMAMQNIDQQVVILTATSGDTGKAALEGFADVEGTKILVFFPQNGVSRIQKLQMLTQEGVNTFVAAIEGNFDDAQNAVKSIFNDKQLVEELSKKGYILSSANSINIGRLIPQIVYYFYGYLTLLREGKITQGQEINVVVPTGNFGNILAAYYAKKMGLPIGKLLCASNENNVLYDFIHTGTYDRQRDLRLTSSPSMDILISSNLERLLYEISGQDDVLVNQLMQKLSTEGIYEITNSMKEKLMDFYGDYSSEAEVFEAIKQLYQDENYIIDTHTAVAYSVYQKYRKKTGDATPTIIASTASPFKFGKDVSRAIGLDIADLDDFDILEKLAAAAKVKLPNSVSELKTKPILHHSLAQKHEIKAVVEGFLGGK
ncbi:MAG: threonine synthase [Clostridiales bacterium GWB2_37_7]|nr:MAG: threonine synthase [Clostridiales bacterium GWB2_37_7]